MGKTWKELGVWRRGGRSKRSKKGKKAKAVRFVSFSQNEGLKGEERRRRRRGTVVELENLGMKVEWVDGKVYIHRNYRNVFTMGAYQISVLLPGSIFLISSTTLENLSIQ